MSKVLIIQGKLGNTEEIYKYIKKNNMEIEIIKVDEDVIQEKSILKKTIYFMKMIKHIGVYKFLIMRKNKKVIILCESLTNFFRIISKDIILMNHGWGTKQTPGNLEKKNKNIIKNQQKNINAIKYIICNSKFDSTYYLKNATHRNIEKIKYLPFGSPRNDLMLRDSNLKKESEYIKEKYKHKEIILYAPTHREKKEFDEEFMMKILKEFQEIDEQLGDMNKVLLFRPHYYYKGLDQKMKCFKSIKLVEYSRYPDPRILMLASDCLITDYSSIFVDYILLNKPIYFYMHDYEFYEEIRGLVIEKSNKIHFPGKQIDSLIKVIKDHNKNKNIDLLESKKHFHGEYSGDATKKIVDFINQY